MKNNRQQLFLTIALFLGVVGLLSYSQSRAQTSSVIGATVQLSVCGNGVKESGEQCDGTDYGGVMCSSLGYDAGTLSCSDACTYVATSCTTAATAFSNESFVSTADHSTSLPDGDNGVAVIVPQDSYAGELALFLFSHPAADLATAKPSPGSQNVVGKLYDLRFVDPSGEILHTLDKASTVTLSYTTADLGTLRESTLAPYQSEDGSSTWTAIPDYTRDTTAKTVTFTTNEFSTFGIFGSRARHSSHGTDGTTTDTTDTVDVVDQEQEKPLTPPVPKITPEEKKKIIKVADFNGDGRVDISDLSIILFYFDQIGSTIEKYDLNHDGTIDIADVSIMLYYWEVTT